MPTLYGQSSGTPGVTPTIVDAGWTRTSSGIIRAPAALTDSTAAATFADAFVASVHSSCLGQFIYGPLAAQTISGTISAAVTARDATYTNIYITAIAAWIATSAGALRGTLLSKTNDPSAINWTTAFNSFSMGPLNMASVNCSANDYLILECGLADTSFTNSEQGILKAGGSTTRFTLSNSIQLFNPTSYPSVLWLGRPQPKRS